jgi:alpha-L-fucosidase
VWQGREIGDYNEQIQHRARIPGEEYAKLAEQFDPARFDPDAIARMARDAGMRYVVITSKHHDGFNLFHTRLSPFNSVEATPWGKDAIRLLSEACHRQGVRFGVYFSNIDWHYPGAAPMSDHNSDPITPALEAYALGQLRELLTRYGPLCEVWFDMGHPTPEQSAAMAGLVRSLQPDCLVSGRIFNQQEDFLVCGDNEVPEHWFEGAWEVPATVHPDTWGYRSWGTRPDRAEKTREKIRDLAFVAARGGNYLLNVGPRGDGSIPEYDQEVLRDMGRWLQVHGEALYGTRPEPHLRLPYGYATSRPGRLYLFVASPPEDGILRVPGWVAAAPRAHALGQDPALDLACQLSGTELSIQLPPDRLDSDLTVVALDTESDMPVLPADVLRANGSLTLQPAQALAWYRLAGTHYGDMRRRVVAREWTVLAGHQRSWKAELHRSQAGPAAGYLISAGDQWLQAVLPATQDPVTQELGMLTLPEGAPVAVRLRSIEPGRELRDAGVELRLVPA